MLLSLLFLAIDCPKVVPQEVAPAADQQLDHGRRSTGVQIYVCVEKKWVLIAPQANLYHDGKALSGTHFIGPTWQDNDGSSVEASKLAAATVDATAIPWLLLKAKSSGEGKLASITSIQRLNTKGGLAPAFECASGQVEKVPYTADYFFYVTKEKAKRQCR